MFFFNDTATTEIYTLSLHDALPISPGRHRGPAAPLTPREVAEMALRGGRNGAVSDPRGRRAGLRTSTRGHRSRPRSEEHTSELQSRQYLVCRLLLEKQRNQIQIIFS